MKREILKASMVMVAVALMLVILVVANCGHIQPQAQGPTVIVFCDDKPDEIKARVQKAMYQKPQVEVDRPWHEDFISWFNRYGGFASLLALPFLIW